MYKRTLTSVLASTLLGACALLHAELKLPAVFSDNLVLQGGKSLPVWGWGESGKQVTVTIFDLDGESISSADGVVDSTGKWRVDLDAVEPGTKGTVLISELGGESITLENMVVGEVWLASGQSNMDWHLSRTENAKEAIASMNYPEIRFFKVPRRASDEPLEDVNAEWVVISPETSPSLSAVALYFAVKMHTTLDRPVGILQSAWGGTQVEPWISKESFVTSQYFEHRMKALSDAEAKAVETMADYEEALRKWQAENTTEELRRANRNTMPRNPTPEPRSYPTYLYNGMIHALVPYSVEGALWYQGESNAGRASQYRELFPLLIKDWRKLWSDEDLGFIYVELANYRAAQKEPVEGGWALIREAQHFALELPHTGVASAIDVGDPSDIHPRDKKTVGERMAKIALGYVHDIGEPPFQSPRYDSHEITNGKVIMSFKETGGELKTKDGEPPRPFAIKGETGGWQWAETRIEGDKIIAWHPDIAEPVAVRYAWASNPDVNVYNTAGLPLITFRTDID